MFLATSLRGLGGFYRTRKLAEVKSSAVGPYLRAPLSGALAKADPAIFGGFGALLLVLHVLTMIDDAQVLPAVVVGVAVLVVALTWIAGIKAKNQAMHAYRCALAFARYHAHRVSIRITPPPLIQPLKVSIVNEHYGLDGAVSPS